MKKVMILAILAITISGSALAAPLVVNRSPIEPHGPVADQP